MINANHLKLGTVIEIGCGTGEVLKILSNTFPKAQFDGYEISNQALEKAKIKERTNLHFHADIGTDLPKVDLLLLVDVFEHVTDYIGFLEKQKDRARYKIMHIPLDINIIDVFRKNRLSGKRRTAGHLHYFTKDTALDTLKDCGYKIIDWRYTPWCLELHHSFAAKTRNIFIRALYAINKDFAVRFFGGFSLLVLCE
ncbi:MAG: class I SAM-dependent methyltransferase [Gemmatimonadaceae bacterium]|nr:class I SAM-dependent methyltransferase [Chitinophagaceae bacterium]